MEFPLGLAPNTILKLQQKELGCLKSLQRKNGMGGTEQEFQKVQLMVTFFNGVIIGLCMEVWVIEPKYFLNLNSPFKLFGLTLSVYL